ncbi:hypothetical protein PFICI_15376 [Pestalotiopsis fici W106-1]|uniref:Zn(2)-C6 fungal-type domain-containing protein n=1 Tax=Pestalotiopsis fici (strain W106-1 / CGMCC3.15140) TaxID=1229662 RepID=W3WGQ3_PESFW|nr:uncharacterized protein PFICI_15376 [Pestalotiopsis fici W106-1]ETS72984.1 hypothetical protein PFICI_15376 [Pestalotiopsis fici W106-1]
MAEAQEPPLQPQAQQVQPSAQAQAQALPLPPGGPVMLIPAVANEETNSRSHGSLPALVSSNLPDPSVLDRSPSQPSQAPAELETHTQYCSTTNDSVQAHVKSSQDSHRQREKPQPEGIGPSTKIQQASAYGATGAVEGIEAERRDVDKLPGDATHFAPKAYLLPALVHVSGSVSTATKPSTTAGVTTTISSIAVPFDLVRSTAKTPSARDTNTVLDYEIIADDIDQLHTSSAPPSPSPPVIMSNPPQHPGHQRPPVGFPSPTYGSQGIYGYGSPTGPPGDPYRGPSGGHQPMSLPSMRTFDPVQQQQAQQVPMAQQMMQVQATMPPYYAHPVPLPGNPYSMPPDAMASRYALPPTDPRFLGNPRNKKQEIKRRTKTGCLTCRKRRIKCDEQHPVCKNCQKSKRECLGYDPIFKQQQQQQQHTTIQPASNTNNITNTTTSHPTPSASVPSNGPSSLLPPTSSSSSVVPGPNSSGTYSSLPSVLPSSYNSGASSSSNTPGHAYEPSQSAPPQTIKGEHFEYGPAIDPALDSVGAPPSTSTSHLPPVKSVTPIASPLPQRPPNSTLTLRGGGPVFTSQSAQQSVSPFHHWTPAYSDNSAKNMRVDELVSLGRPLPPEAKSLPDQAQMDEIRGLYDEIYAPGLEKFFETRWYTQESTGTQLVTVHDSVVKRIAALLSLVGRADQQKQNAMTESANAEFRTVWDLACLPFATPPRINPPSVIPPDHDSAEARNRVYVIEALLSGTILMDNPLVRPPPSGDLRRVRELDFWYHLGEFCRVEPLGNPPNPIISSQRDQILNRIRTLLDGRENRDVLYSVAIMRALSPEFPPDFESTLPQHLDENDPKSKLAVARKFVQDESKVTGGTTNIVRRFSELATLAFINPGVNVLRSA